MNLGGKSSVLFPSCLLASSSTARASNDTNGRLAVIVMSRISTGLLNVNAFHAFFYAADHSRALAAADFSPRS